MVKAGSLVGKLSATLPIKATVNPEVSVERGLLLLEAIQLGALVSGLRTRACLHAPSLALAELSQVGQALPAALSDALTDHTDGD